jgi:hypothetical protein
MKDKIQKEHAKALKKERTHLLWEGISHNSFFDPVNQTYGICDFRDITIDLWRYNE